MENKKQLLKKIIERNEKLKSIVFVGFNTEKELLDYRKKIAKERDEYFNNQEKIQQLEWELMTTEEKEERKKYLRFLELKGKGEPFDLEEFI